MPRPAKILLRFRVCSLPARGGHRSAPQLASAGSRFPSGRGLGLRDSGPSAADTVAVEDVGTGQDAPQDLGVEVDDVGGGSPDVDVGLPDMGPSRMQGSATTRGSGIKERPTRGRRRPAP